MNKKGFLISLLAIFTAFFVTLASCAGGGATGASDSESVESFESVVESLSESEVESEPESEIESEVISRPDNISAPTFSFTLTPSTTSLTINVKEDDPYDVGQITAIELVLGSDKVSIDDLDTRVIDGLYSGVNYSVNITYTYDIGGGTVSQTYKKSRYTVGMKTPEIDVTYTPISETSFSFDLNATDPDGILEIAAIKLLTEEGDEVAELDDLTQRVFEDIPSGRYYLKVDYKYDLNRGEGTIEDSISSLVATVISPLTIPDFIVEVPEGREVVILQISDTQIIDNTQVRAGDTAQSSYYAPEKMEDRLFKFLRETINATKPDLILITGDLVYGKYDDKGTSLLALIDVMDSFQIPWAPVFGNHDNESKKGADWQCEQLENAEYCLFKQRELSGNGNYTVGIAQGGKLTRVFFMMDTNGCGNASAESLANGHTYNNYVGFKEDQVDWFMEVGTQIKDLSPDTKISFAFHIQMSQFKNALSKYGFTNVNTKENPIYVDWLAEKEDGDFGFIGADLKSPWDSSNVVFNKMVSLGVDSIYVGHEHNNNASVVYNGIRYQFSQKISTYDRCNWLRSDGTILCSYPEPKGTKELMGGSVNILDETGAIVDGYIYYCNDLDPTKPPAAPVVVNGLQAGTTSSNQLWPDANLTVVGEVFDNQNAYKVTAVGQGKFYVNTSILANKNTFSFTIYVPSSSSNRLGGMGEFAIRVKPDACQSLLDLYTSGYLDYDSKDTRPELKIVFDQWVTYTIDVSRLGTTCTEWAFLIPIGNVVYLRDITIL